MVAAAFDTAGRLFGVSFVARAGSARSITRMCAPTRCATTDGQAIGLFLHDNFARPGKRSGAWMSSYRDQENLDGAVLPIVVNNNNFSKGDPTLLSFDDAETLFHEFGHGLHGLLEPGALSARNRAPRCGAILSSSRRRSSSIGCRRRRRCAAMPAITRPASRCPRRCCGGCSRRAISTRASPRSNTPPAR